MYRKKKVVIITMCIAILLMAVGYAAFSSNLKINGTASVTSTWQILFTKIEEVSKTDGVTIISSPTASGTTATFNVGLELPGDAIEYKITVENQGTVDAIINDIVASETGSDAIKFEIENIKEGDILNKESSTTFNITISYDINVASQPTFTDNELSITINYIQYTGQSITPVTPTIESPTLVNKILKTESGLYSTNINTEDNKTTYYFSGNITTNYVEFAAHIWRIVRINEDGSIRIVKEESIGSSLFNDVNCKDRACVGYMYGELGSTSYDLSHANTTDSLIKYVVDSWYINNLKDNYSSYLSDAGFCGDRSLAGSEGGGTSDEYYGASARSLPQFGCLQSRDLYTTKTSTKGNQALEYPIGLLSYDEVLFASSYLDTSSSDYWTMTPFGFNDIGAGPYLYYSGGYDMGLYSEHGVRPVINLKSTVEIESGGTGTSTNPYVIKTSS